MLSSIAIWSVSFDVLVLSGCFWEFLSKRRQRLRQNSVTMSLGLSALRGEAFGFACLGELAFLCWLGLSSSAGGWRSRSGMVSWVVCELERLSDGVLIQVLICGGLVETKRREVLYGKVKKSRFCFALANCR